MKLKMKVLDTNCLPYKKYATDRGIDVRARLKDRISVSQLSTVKIPTGIAIQVPNDYTVFVLPRSGLSSQGISAEIGTIDDFTGEISVNLTNNTNQPFIVQPYDRIAQLVMVKTELIEGFDIVKELDETDRGANGFGSTGIK